MVKNSAKPKQTASSEESLWDSANKLRGSVESSEYKHTVLSFIFLKFISDKFEAHRQALIEDGKEAFVDIVSFYTQSNIFYLEEALAGITS
ncbi:type I restriction-modification system subunit M N-terminal domain-containing protein [Microbulbifer sp. TYP-18]|uniref:type I restriction-modification system subunit M N-terminal domain-containing protein n=1 Tax=Microbulbifer sp. TYP-18 TaxID=3230024 RepID=UPI0034C63300